ncbi:MAG: hypothetical protein JWQ66_2981 [Mucilaginibacter sp.]|nr:hypothetical protein [Mucilaginibacter sp.]
MCSSPLSDPSKKMTSAKNDPLSFLNNESSGLQNNPQTDLIQSLLYEVIRVKDLIKYYESIPNSAGRLSASILDELVLEAYNSMVNYDIILMKKYYDLLQNCD